VNFFGGELGSAEVEAGVVAEIVGLEEVHFMGGGFSFVGLLKAEAGWDRKVGGLVRLLAVASVAFIVAKLVVRERRVGVASLVGAGKGAFTGLGVRLGAKGVDDDEVKLDDEDCATGIAAKLVGFPRSTVARLFATVGVGNGRLRVGDGTDVVD
jgi:hypothetical protein